MKNGIFKAFTNLELKKNLFFSFKICKNYFTEEQEFVEVDERIRFINSQEKSL